MTNRYALPPLPEPLCNLPTYCQDAIMQYARTVLDDHLNAQDAAIEADHKSSGNNQEPFGYFRAIPFGWEDCAPTDEGAIALYERP